MASLANRFQRIRAKTWRSTGFGSGPQGQRAMWPLPLLCRSCEEEEEGFLSPDTSQTYL
jgi:hypothetical protein